MEKKELLFPLALIIIISFANTFWLIYDTTPQAWDESIHLNAAASFTHELKKGPAAFIKSFITQEDYYPPLVPAIASFAGLLNISMDTYTHVNLFFYAILILSVFMFTRKIIGFYPACVAAVLVCSMPLIYTQGHFFMFDLPLTAITSMILFLLSDTYIFSSRKKAALFGLVLGLAMLIKWTFFIYVIAPYILRIIEEKKQGKKIITGIAIHIAIMILIAGPWYFYNFYSIVSKIFMYSFKRGKIEGLPSIFSLESFLYYIRMLPDKAGIITLILAIAGAIAAVVMRDRKGLKILLFFITPIIIMTLLHNKKDRYIMPAMPFMAMLAAYTISLIKNKKVMIAASSATILLSLFMLAMAILPFNFTWPNSARPKKDDWKIEKLLSMTQKGKNLAVVPDHPMMNVINYSFYSKYIIPSASIIGIYNFPMFADYFLIKTGWQGPFFSGSEKREIITKEALAKTGVASYYDLLYETSLPDGEKAMLFKRKENINVNPQIFSATINKSVLIGLSYYMKESKDFKFSYSIDEKKALIKNFSISFSSALIGDFKHKPAALEIKNGNIEVFNIILNPEELAGGSISLLSLEKIRINSLEVDEKSLEKFVSYYIPNYKISIKIKNNLIDAEADLKFIKIKISLELYKIDGENTDLGFKIKKVKAGFLNLPAFIFNIALKDYNPLLNRTKVPLKIEFKELSLNDGKLKIIN